MTRRAAGVVVLAWAFLAGCTEDSQPKRDIVMDVAAAMGEGFDTPASRGGELYSRYCSVCHGATGKGDGFNAFNLNPKPRNFSDTAFVRQLDTTLIREAISRGGRAVGLSGLMPPWRYTLTKRDIDDLVIYVAKLSATE
ncbi:MAG TPA: c-type cytochrome [Candidatus Deferrimicrobium sp.]|nr:c-type cytochrome [Candidatus Deferrimicrobium sp.]